MNAGLPSLDGREIIWTPQPRQQLALRCPADEMLYGGAKGGGKSDFLLMAPYEQMALCDRQYRETGRKQRGRAILFRKNLGHLEDLIRRSKELFPSIDAKMGIGGWNKNEKKWEFSSGYTYEFTHLDGPDDHEVYQGQEITAALFDQVEDFAFNVYQFICAQVRTKNDEMRPLLLKRCTANPGGRHAAWVKDYFVVPCDRGKKVVSDEIKLPSGRTHTLTRAFVPAKLADNKYLYNDPAYEAELAKLPDHMREMYLDGNWDVVVGSFFAGVWDPRKHVISSFSIPSGWQLKFGMDWGTTSPAAWLLGARDNDGNVYIIDEIYGPGKTGRIFGERILNRFKHQRWSNEKRWDLEEVYGLLDPSTFKSKTELGAPTAATSMSSMGIRLFPAINSRPAGIEQVLERLTVENGKPKVFIFADRCPNLIRTLPSLPADEHNPNDVDTDAEDHAFDAFRYLLMDWPVSRAFEEKKGDRDVERWLELARAQHREPREESVTGYD